MAGSRAGLKKVTKVVRGKKGTVKRTYWVKATEAAKGAGRFLNKHKGKIAGAALAAGAAYLAHKGAVRGVAFHKAAQQANWSPSAARAHAVKGFKQGAGAPFKQASSAVRGAVSGMRTAVGRVLSERRIQKARETIQNVTRSAVRKAQNKARGASSSTGIKVRRSEARGWEGSGVRQRHAQSRFADI